MIGRDAWDEANKDIEVNDTFTTISKPLTNVALMQTVSSVTKKALVVAALIDDDRAEAYYRKVAEPRGPTKRQYPQGSCDA
ncbi:hypothetical protein NLG97_g4147 [Lecanicillium saksenae]|uniref:Uncharacterized protein n=1 Tax=Lecanicillium saksenae TaxID=468837 RepID=A0ACC1QZE7_9HYPO|nr:hypothetical protein NLG97_g4147 [Lecanicillium saksenae]